METVPHDFDAMNGRVITRGLDGLMFQCVLSTDDKRAYDVFEGGNGSKKVYTLTIERYENPTPHMTERVKAALDARAAAVKDLRKGLRTPDRRKKARA